LNRRLILILPLILAAALFTVSPSVPSAHALTGLVCITDSTSATSCPASPPSLGPFTVGQTFSIGIFVQGSDAMGGFDIYIATDAGFVNPTSAALGTLITTPTSTIICINGLSVSGACTVGTANGPGVVEVSTLESLGSNECGGLSPCSGMAFTITYQVVGATPSTQLSYPTGPGCGTSSVANPPNVCVLVSTAFGDTLSESIQAATVTQAPTADFSITANPTSVSAVVGVPATSTITISPSNGFNNGVSLTSDNPSSCTLTPSTVTGGSGTSTLSCTFTGTGSVPVTVTGAGGGLSHSTTVTYTVSPAPDFTISANPTSVTTTVGVAGISIITIGPLNGFAGDVALVSDNPSACTLTPSTVTGGSGTSNLSCAFAVAGSVTVTVTGTSGSLTHTATVDYTATPAPDFSISANPVTVSVTVGTAGTSTITISPLNGFTGDVALSSDSAACALTPTTIASGSGTSTLSCTFTSAGSVTVTVTGTSGSLSHTATVSFTVTAAPDFNISANPTAVTVVVNSAGTSTITISPLNGFTSDVALSADNAACTLTPATVTGGSGSSTLSCTFTSAGSVTVTVTGTSGSLSHSATVDFTVTALPDFTISASPITVTVSVGSAGTSTITVASLNGFASNVALAADNVACTLTPTTVTGGSGTSILSCTFNTAGSVTVTVTGTSGSLSHSATVDFTVTAAADFSIAANPTSVSATIGVAATSTITVSPLNGFTGDVALVSDNGACTLGPSTVTGGSGTSTLSCTFTSTGSVTVTVTGTSGSLSHTVTVDFTVGGAPDFTITANPTAVSVTVGTAGTSTITISPANGFTGDVALANDNNACILTPATVTGGSGSSTLSCTFGSTGSITVTLTGTSGSLSHSATVTYTVTAAPDFTIYANPTAVTVVVNSAGTSTITISPANGFAGDVALISDNAACTLTPTMITGGSGNSVLSCTFGAAGTVTVTVTGTSGSLSHSATVTYTVTSLPDFTISASPTAVTVTVGSAGTSTITISPLNGFTGDVALASDNAACTLNPATVTGGSGTSTLSCTFTSAGGVTVTVTGTSGSLSHSATVDYTVTALPPPFDYSLTNNGPVSITAGSSGTVTITATLTAGTAQPVAPSCVTPLPSGVTCTSFNPSSVTPTASSVLTITVASGTAAGTVTVDVTGTPLGATTAATTVSVTITSVIPPLTVDFSFSPSSPNVGQSVSFTPTVSGGTAPYTYAWDFGDGGTSTAANPNHTYSTAGSFTAKLTVTDSSSPTQSQTASHDISVSPITGQKDFTISASPTSITLVGESPLCEGGSTLCDDEGSTTITLTSINGFNGTVRLARSVSPRNGLLTVYCRPSATQLLPGATINIRCFVEPETNPDTTTTFTMTITGRSGAMGTGTFLSHSVTITVTVTHAPTPPEDNQDDPPPAPSATSTGVSSTRTTSAASGPNGPSGTHGNSRGDVRGHAHGHHGHHHSHSD